MSGDAKEKFRTHQNYVRALACLCGREQPYRDQVETLAGVGERTQDSANLRALQRQPSPPPQVRHSLRTAWGTELLLALAGTYAADDELVRFTNAWGVVQLYYAVYHAVQALLLAKGQARPTSHELTKKQYLDLWVKPTGASGLSPLCLAWGNRGPVGLPPREVIDNDLPNWGRCDATTCWTLALRAMRTTREEELRARERKRRQDKKQEKRAAWEKGEAQRVEAGRKPRKKPDFPLARLTPTERAAVNHKLRDYSMLDYLYRLRIKANYEDAGMFTDGPDDDELSRRVHIDLVNIGAASLLVHELHIRQLVGFTVMERWSREWVDSNPVGIRPMGLAARVDLLLKKD